MRFIHAALLRSGGGGVVLAGAAGVGKTRLAREAMSAQRGGRCRRWVSATASGHALPFGAFATVLGEIDGTPTQLLGRAVSALQGSAGGRELVLAVDDAHLLDDLSALLVHQVVLRGVATVVVTVRVGEPCPDPLTSLWKEGQLDRLEVQALSEAETCTLLEVVLHGPVASRVVSRMWRLTRGNALFLRQLVDGELGAGRLRQTRGVWQWPTDGPVMSGRLVELITAKMGTLSDSVRDVVDLLAVAEPLSVGMLSGLTDPAAVERAETTGLIELNGDGRSAEVRLGHPLYGEARRADIGQLRAQRLRGRVATALAAADAAGSDDILRRAVLSLDSDLPPVAPLLATAAERAIRLLDLSLGERLSRAAVSAGGGLEARLALGFVLSWSARGEEAERALAALADLAEDDALSTEVAVLRAGNSFWILEDPEAALTLVAAAESRTTEEMSRRALLCARSMIHAALGHLEEAVREARAGLSSSEVSDRAVMCASWGLLIGLGTAGQIDEATQAATPVYAATRHSFVAAIHLFPLSSLHLIGLRLAGHVEHMALIAADRRTESLNLPAMAQSLGLVLLAHASLASGRVQTTIRLFNEALGQVEDNSWRTLSLVWLTHALAMAGDPVRAVQTLAEMERDFHPGFEFIRPDAVLARAWVAAAQGSNSEAIAAAHDAAHIAAARGQWAYEVLALEAACRFGDRAVADRLDQLADVVSGPRAVAAAAQARALASDDGAGLAAASTQYEAFGDLLAAADAAAQAVGAFDRRHMGRDSHLAAARAQRLSLDCEGAKTPALIQAARPLPLSARELEIVSLAATGLSNRAIADRLTVSVRTVEGHLYRAFAKLGTTNRTELAELLRAP